MRNILVVIVLAVCLLYTLVQSKPSCAKFCLARVLDGQLKRKNVRNCVRTCIKDNNSTATTSGLTKAKRFLKKLAENLPEDDEEMADAATMQQFRVNSDIGLRLRATPCGQEITMLPNQAVVTYLGRQQSACNFVWYNVQTSFGTGWVASNYLVAVQGGSQPQPPKPQPQTGFSVSGDIGGLNAGIRNKLQEIANSIRASINVISGKRNWGDRHHQNGDAADFHINGYSDSQAYNVLKNNFKHLFAGTQLIYHVPGARTCTTHEHLHLARPPTYKWTSFCLESKCAFDNTECTFQ